MRRQDHHRKLPLRISSRSGATSSVALLRAVCCTQRRMLHSWLLAHRWLKEVSAVQGSLHGARCTTLHSATQVGIGAAMQTVSDATLVTKVIAIKRQISESLPFIAAINEACPSI